MNPKKYVDEPIFLWTFGARFIKSRNRLNFPVLATHSYLLQDTTVTAEANEIAKSRTFCDALGRTILHRIFCRTLGKYFGPPLKCKAHCPKLFYKRAALEFKTVLFTSVSYVFCQIFCVGHGAFEIEYKVFFIRVRQE